MDRSFSLHDYRNCIANLPNSVLKKFGVSPMGQTLPFADELLKKDCRNVVVLLLDGLGTYIMEGNLSKDGFLRKHFRGSISSVFPPTTVAATTSVMSGLQPVEHAWLGWDCYYPQVGQNVTVFLNTVQGTDRPVSEENIPRKYCGYETVIGRLNREGKQAFLATPFADPYPDSFGAVCGRIADLCADDGEKYIYAYWNEPDAVMHRFGCRSDEAKRELAGLEKTVEEMCADLKDTLLIVTADHGHIDGRNVSVTDYPAIMECLVRMPSIEPRALNLFVKEEKKQQFEAEFKREFGNDFVLLTKEELYRTKLLGDRPAHSNVDAMLGDYLAVSMTDLTILNTREEAELYRGVHAGYTAEELTIPLIVVDPAK